MTRWTTTEDTPTTQAGFSVLELVVVLAVAGVLLAIALPRMSGYGSNNDSRVLSNALSLAKMRAASNFTQSRLYVSLAGRSQHVELWSKTAVPPDWVAVNGPTLLTNGEVFGFGPAASPPANTQALIGQAPVCLDKDLNPIAGTACILFNSRGIPVDDTGTPTNNDALYVTDGTRLGAVTLSAAGLVTVWDAPLGTTPAWARK
jgi:prepilin-type N-terminal cleavage/methylation domain-containing protein